MLKLIEEAFAHLINVMRQGSGFASGPVVDGDTSGPDAFGTMIRYCNEVDPETLLRVL